MTLKPMLAADCRGDVSLLRFPLLASPKLDGVRCIILNGVALSRSLKPIPNSHVQQWAAAHCTSLEGMDGELIVGSPTQKPGDAETVMARTMSGVMSKDGKPDFTFHIFDCVPPATNGKLFDQRFRWSVAPCMAPRTQLVAHTLILGPTQLDEYEASMLAAGYEGIMTRQPGGLYKQGRSTMKEQGLVKVKRFSTYEAEVVGVEEQMHNDNEKVGEGIQKRGSCAAGLRPAGVLGALVCRRPDGVEFNIGTGFTAEQRKELWAGPPPCGSPIGLTVTYRCFDYGSKDAPRFPVFGSFVSFRSKEDMS